MADAPIAQFLDSLETKLQGISDITDPNNVMIGESANISDLGEDEFARLEVLIVKNKGDGYDAQRFQNYQFRFSTAGYMKRENADLVKSDMVNLMNFDRRVRNAIFGMLDDNQTTSIAKGFEKFGGFNESFYEFEVFYESKIMTFILEMEAHFFLQDVEVI